MQEYAVNGHIWWWYATLASHALCERFENMHAVRAMVTDVLSPSERGARLRMFDNNTVMEGFAVLPNHCTEHPRHFLFNQWKSSYTCLMQLCIQLGAVILQS